MSVEEVEEIGVGPTGNRRDLPWTWIIFAVALATGLMMALVVFRFQSLVDQDIDPYLGEREAGRV